MRLVFHPFRWGCFFLLLFLIASCNLNQGLKKPEAEKDFFGQTSYLEKVARYHPDLTVRAKSHQQLALLYVNHRNPELDYARALQEIESYLLLSPTKEEEDYFNDWLAILREVDHLRKDGIEMEKKNQTLRGQIDRSRANLIRFQKANIQLSDEVAKLKEMNNKMIQTIETLNDIDRQIEERRREERKILIK